MVNACISTLCDITQSNKDIVVMGSDFQNVGEQIAKKAPGQYIDFGIAEATLVGAAAGLAASGLIPIVYAVSPFLAYRALEFIRDDICLQKRNVKIIGYSAGMDYCTSGPTHHTTEDIGVLRVMPELKILSPASVKETIAMVEALPETPGPVYLRLNRERNREVYKDDYQFCFNKAYTLHEGDCLTVFCTGSIAYDAVKVAELFEKERLSIRVIHFGTIKPLDIETISQALKESKAIVTLEEHNILGGLGGAIAEIMAEKGSGVPLLRLGLNDTFAKGYGNHDEIKALNQLSIDNIYQRIKTFIKGIL